MSINDKTSSSHLPLRAILLGIYFFLILAGYYQVKPLSRTLFMTYIGTDNLPYVWIAATIVLTTIMPFYHNKLKSFYPSTIIYSSSFIFIILLAVSWITLRTPSVAAVVIFYILVDIYSVLMVENFWSLTNSTFDLETGKPWYGLIASGGLFGGMLGSLLAAHLVDKAYLVPVDLILVLLFSILISLLLVRILIAKRFVNNNFLDSGEEANEKRSNSLPISTYIKCLVGLLLAAQLIEPLVEYIFLQTVERSIPTLSERTQYVSLVFSATSALGLISTIILFPIVNRYIGWLSGLIMQPLSIVGFALAYMWTGSLMAVSALKVVDRGLAYSFGRASRELIYVILPSSEIFRIKAWVDMYGYRFFKIFGSFLVLGLTSLLTKDELTPAICFSIILITFFWGGVIYAVKSRLYPSQSA